MKELTVISGKGGTGKTSITASIASLAERRIVIDADVDAANLFLTLEHNLIETEQFQGGYKAKINPELCIGCKECFKRCQFDAIFEEITENIIPKLSKQKDEQIRDNRISPKFAIDPIACEGCGVCVHFCPTVAISFERQICGEKYISTTANGPMIHARLGIAEENSGLLVSQLRQKAREMAKEQKIPLIITDGPPGIGCPVIASISNADALLIVTEPTLSAIHDMKRVIKLGRQMNAPIYVCINKADLNKETSENIKEFCVLNNIKFAGEIPFDRAVVESMKMGKALVTYSDGAASKAVKEVWENVKLFMGDTMERVF
ncbi:MAG: ATP-binding protein [Desulfamplus sp.]|nr:ATP-binding protein [Desulfamplus sp.]